MSGAERSFAGFVYQQRLATEFYGEVHRALGAGGQEARILHIAPSLAATPGFADALTKYGDRLGLLEHKHVQQTILVGLTDDGTYVVVNEALAGPRSLADLLGAADALARPVPKPVSYAIARAVVAALMHAHGVGIVHGSVHPRSVAIDIHGHVRLVHFAAARALAEAAAGADDLSLYQAKEFVAPELALGEAPCAATDVYAFGALMTQLLPSDMPAPIAGWLERAVATDAEARFPSAIDMRAALRDAMTACGAEAADGAAVAAFASKLGAAPATESDGDAELDDATEGVLADLAAEEFAPDEEAKTDIVEPPGIEDELDDLVAGLDSSDDDGGTDVADPPTAVDAVPGGQTSSDPVSALIRARSSPSVKQMVRLGAETFLREDEDDEDTYIPPAITDSDVDLATAAERATSNARLHTNPDTDIDMDPVPRPAKPSPVRSPTSTDTLTAPPLRRKGNGIWAATTALTVAVLALVVYTQTDLFDAKKRAQTEAERAADLARRQAEVDAKAIRAGDITVDSEPDEAAVWMLIGRTPVDSLPLSASAPHQIRIEHEGFAPADITIAGPMWTGSGTGQRASVSAKLQPAAPGDLAPAAPPAPAVETTGREGRGPIHVESEPPGAKAYMLVGFTPAVTLSKVRAGVGYEFKVVKDGYTPGFVLIRPDDWQAGDGLKRSIDRSATLLPLPKAGK